MPNWTFNELEVDGDVKEVKRFMKSVKKGKSLLSFRKHLPIPEELMKSQSPPKTKKIEKVMKKKYGFRDWYDWCVGKWGTKWDACGVDIDDNGNYHFETAWAPPSDWLIFVSKLFPTLKFTLWSEEEGDMWQAFEASVENGKWKEKKWKNH